MTYDYDFLFKDLLEDSKTKKERFENDVFKFFMNENCTYHMHRKKEKKTMQVTIINITSK